MNDALNNWMNGLLDYWIIGWFARKSAPIHSSIHPAIHCPTPMKRHRISIFAEARELAGELLTTARLAEADHPALPPR